MKYLSIQRFFIIVLLIFSFTSCYDNVQSSIPDFPVYLELNLTTTYPTFKNSNNQALLFEKPIVVTDRIGYGGILVYTGFDGQYYAFDMACPYEAQPTVRVYPNELGEVVCKSCGSIFEIGYGIGNPKSGPAKEILKRYRANLVGDILTISR